MDSYELNKIAGAILCALLAIVLPATLIDMNRESAEHAGGTHAVGYTLPMPEEAAPKAVAGKAKAPDAKLGLAAVAAPTAGGAAGGAAPAAPAAPAAAGGGDIFASVKPLLAAANPQAGAGVFRACAACHSVEKGGANRVGPGLWGVVNRPKGASDGFAYSTALKGMGGAWTHENIVRFINNPKGYVAGTKMVYGGLADPQRLADLVAYLATLSDTPVPPPS